MDATSKVEPDGAVVRSVAVKVGPKVGESTGPGPDKMLVLREPGGWTTKLEAGAQEDVYTATRTISAARPTEGDMVLRLPEGTVIECTIRTEKLSDGRLRYRETWTAVGDKRPGRVLSEAGPGQEWLAELTGLGLSQEQAAKVRTEALKGFSRRIFGPPEPQVGLLLSQPASALRTARAHLFRDLLRLVKEARPELKEDDIRPALLRLARRTGQELESESNAGSSQPESGPPVLISSAVTGPGVPESEGLFDPVDGAAYWSMYADALEFGPVTFEAIFPAAG